MAKRATRRTLFRFFIVGRLCGVVHAGENRHLQLKILPVHLALRIEDQTTYEALQREQRHKARRHERREPRYEPGVQILRQHWAQKEQRRDHLVERMNQIEGVSCIKPEGAFYVMMNMKGFLGKTMYGKVIESAEDFAQLFLEKGLVATVPCTAFAAPGFVRWSYATSLTEIDKGLDRLEAFIKNA